ncbi:Cytosine/adenosine deaminase [Quadrisphaera granulorum]|uniref:Cytosine/adenosine deaminase-related metal-dependent hydrolase n=1 Tax=Quadrisphaera granulorum TaxID=317664 RepID=A0A316A8D3_9ACTN|nr:amidohydrolase family protein [Quadrisphaera granulorum]PWJ53995.1 cytosine/adenosine deaminase-related metal-dependent hydrolase [Quadrisphaera granulorum]SZE96452.1 Cytosine/adenosine deaminase [Quadrisphaera granulorum]
MTRSLTITSASLVVERFDDPERDRTGDLVIGADGRVAGPAPGPGASGTGPGSHDVLDAAGCIVTPGLINAHHHLLQSGFRTLPGTRGVPMRDWLPAMAAAYASAGIDASLVAATAGVGLAESLLCGVTTVADHQLNWPDPSASRDPVGDTVAIARAIADAAASLGARLVFVRGSARDAPEVAAASAEAIVTSLLRSTGSTRSTSSPAAPGGTSTDGMLQLAVGPAGVHSDSETTFRALGDVARRYGLRRRTQANEQVDTEIALARYGRRPLDLLEDWGWLAPDVTVAHLCDVTEEEITRLAAAGVTATHAPGCDVPMGWGIAPVRRLREAGVVVGLGTSGGGSNDAGHLLADARLAMQVSGLVGPQLPARDVLAMATSGGAAGLGRAELGVLSPGAAGDACVWDVSGVADAGVADPVAGLLWANPGRRPRHVVVGGRVVVRDYRLVTGDETALTAALRARTGH